VVEIRFPMTLDLGPAACIACHLFTAVGYAITASKSRNRSERWSTYSLSAACVGFGVYIALFLG
jgi:hypothetical protein